VVEDPYINLSTLTLLGDTRTVGGLDIVLPKLMVNGVSVFADVTLTLI